MGSVYLARKHGAAGFVRSVAIKMIGPSAETSPDLDGLFVREALLHARIEHPNVVRVEDFGICQEGHYLVVEYVDGWSLAQVLRACARENVQLPLDVTAAIARAALDGLGAIHVLSGRDASARGAVHGDVSPGNILLSRRGQVKIIDLGVAATDDDDPFTGRFVRGKRGYSSREQAAAAPIDARSDLYSMGVVLWELLTVRRLHVDGRIDAPVTPPSALSTQTTAEMDAVVLRALADDPADRFSTAREMGRAIAMACPSSMFVDAAALADFVLGHLGTCLEKDRAQFEPSDATRVGGAPAAGAKGRSSELERSSDLEPDLTTEPKLAPLLGRDEELEELREALAPERALVSITGAAGVGKTHFGVAAAQAFGASAFVHASGVSARHELEHRVRAALARGPSEGTAIVALLAERARETPWTLFLDGVESFGDGAFASLDQWRAEVPSLRVVLLGRGAPPVPSTRVIRLAPFALPESVLALRESSAFALWAQAVRRVDPTYAAPPRSDDDVLAILALTDGVPLAIGVAAARMATLTPQAIRAELERAAAGRDADDSPAPLRIAVESVVAQLDSSGRRAVVALAHLGPIFSPRAASFVLKELGVSDARAVLQRLVTQNILLRAGDQLSMFSFFRAHLARGLPGSSPEDGVSAQRVKALAWELLRAQARAAMDDARARSLSEEDVPAYLEGLDELSSVPAPDESVRAWLSDVVLWIATEHQTLTHRPSVLRAASRLLEHDPDHAAAHMVLCGGLLDQAEQARHAHAALARPKIQPRRAEVAIVFGCAWILSHLGDVAATRAAAARLRAIADDPANASLDRLKGSLLRAVLLHGVDDPVDAAELVTVLHGLRREGDAHDIGNACRLLVQCDEADLVERHMREVLPLAENCRTNSAATRLATYADALFDLGRVAEAQRIYEATLVYRRPRDLPNQCWRSLFGVALCAAHAEDLEAARAHAELLIETTTMPVLRRNLGGLLAWTLAARGRERRDWIEALRRQPGRDARAGDVWWALADHGVAGDAASFELLRSTVEACRPHARQSFALRAALRMASRALARPGRGGAALPAWNVRARGASIVTPSGEEISLGARPLLARLALVLAKARTAPEGTRHLTVDEIVAECWPDERMSADSAANRVRVCVARLRDAGLRPVLEGGRSGYRFSPDVPLVLDDAAP